MVEPDKSDWSALYEAAMEFRNASPWKWVNSEELFAIENPNNGEVGYCSILGSGQEEFGLGIVLGEEGFNWYSRLILGEAGPEDFDERIMIPMLTMLFVDRDTLQKRDVEVIRSLGLQFRGRNAWPFFRSQQPGYIPWFLEKEEAVFLSTVVHQALVVASEVRSSNLDLFEKHQEGLVLTRYYREGNWREEWRRHGKTDRSPETQGETAPLVDEVRLERLHRKTGKLSGAWELDIFVLPTPIGSVSTRRYFPLCFLVVERRQGFIIDTSVAEPWLTLSQKQDRVIQIFEKAGQPPRDIWVKSDRIRQVVGPIARSLGISLHVGSLSRLEEARDGLFDYFSGHEP